MTCSCVARSPMSCSVHRSHRRLRYSFSINAYRNNTHKGKSILFAQFSFSATNSSIQCSRTSSSSSSSSSSLPRKPVFDFDRDPNEFPNPDNAGKDDKVSILVDKNERLPVNGDLGVAYVRPLRVGEEICTLIGKINEPVREETQILGISINGDVESSLLVTDFVERVGGVESVRSLELFERIGGSVTLRNVNNLLVELVKANEIDLAVKLFHELPSYRLSPDRQTFSTLVRCYCNKNEPEEARRVLDQMVQKGCPPNVVTFTIVINAFSRKGKLQRAFEVFRLMGENGCEPTVRTYNCLINGLCYVGRIEEAFELLMKIKKSSKKPDIYTYTAVMDGFCKVGRSNEALELLQQAVLAGLEPTVVTFNTLFNGFCKEGKPLLGFNLLKQMKERNCKPDYITYNTLLHGLLKWGEITSSLQVYEEMLVIGYEVEERLMNSLLRKICRKSWNDYWLSEDVEKMFERIKKKGNCYPYTYCLVIQTLCIQGETEKAVANLLEMLRIGYKPRPITLNALIRVLCKDGMVDKASQLLFFMNEENIVPSKISYNLLMEEFSQQGRFLEACKIYGAALKRGVVPHCRPGKKLDV
ncbi:hypothetical protein Syun_000056 [Stephania yunnanensis]|uniref:Pentatricopeptide repeat-containing protein n=1 Tax=Stephania yunnanensis TaxID=152371 RepID=A0AAP0LBG4_9MAGN